MDEKQLNQTIGFAILALIAYYVLQMLVPFLFWGVIGLILWRFFLEHKKFK